MDFRYTHLEMIAQTLFSWFGLQANNMIHISRAFVGLFVAALVYIPFVKLIFAENT
jgi:hypothetical protein